MRLLFWLIIAALLLWAAVAGLIDLGIHVLTGATPC